MRDHKTLAIVLRRTDYGEADRIVQILTPLGKKSVLARAVRREKSKLAGGIELFSVSEITLHERKSGELAILTSARLVEYFDAFVEDLDLLERGGTMLREVSRRAEQVDSEEFFEILRRALRALQAGAGKVSGLPVRWRDIVRAWWVINLARVAGEELNLRFDVQGKKLQAEQQYVWSEGDMAFCADRAGSFGAEQIKFLRLLQAANVEVALRVRDVDSLVDDVMYVVRCLERAPRV